MFTGPVGPVEVFFYWPEAVFGNFYWPGASSPGTLHCLMAIQQYFTIMIPACLGRPLVPEK